MSLPIPIHFQDFISDMKGLRLTAATAVASGSLGLLLGTSFDPVDPSGSPKPATVLAEEEKKIEEVSIKPTPTPPSFKLVEREVRKPKWDSFRAGTVHSGIKAWEYNWDCLHFDAIPNQVEADKAEEDSVPKPFTHNKLTKAHMAQATGSSPESPAEEDLVPTPHGHNKCTLSL